MEEQFTHPLEKKLIRLNLKIQQIFLYRVIQKTVLTIFPFALIGSFSRTIQLVFLGKNGLFSNWTDFLSDNLFYQIDDIFSAISTMTLGWISVIAAFSAAKYTAKHFKRDDQLAGITASISLLIVAYTYSRKTPMSFHSAVLGIRGLLFAILLGIFIGYLFKWTSKKATAPNSLAMSSNMLQRTGISIKPILIAIVISVIISDLVTVTFYSNLPETIITALSSTNPSSKPILSLLRTFGLGLYSIIMSFLGWSGPYSATNFAYADNSAATNLQYALNHHTAWGAPNLFNSSTLYHTFATYGGQGATLALIIAILWVSRDRDFINVSRWSLIPSIFNVNSALMSGIPVFFNVIFLIPFILAPMVNMILAVIALQLHLMPPAVYSVPVGTPGPLIAFLGTNGSWQALLFTIISLFVSTIIYIPFVKIAEQVKLQDNLTLEKGGVSREN